MIRSNPVSPSSQNKPSVDSRTVPPFCRHCGEAVPEELAIDSDPRKPSFCCHGCRRAYEFIQSQGLGKFYDLQKELPFFDEKANLQNLDGGMEFAFLDDPEWSDSYLWNSEPRRLKFYLEGIYCAACVWLIERLPELHTDILSATVDLNSHTVEVEIHPKSSLATPAKYLNHMGFRPRPLQRNESSTVHQLASHRKFLMQLGVAAAAAGNIMLLSISNYTGAEGVVRQTFRILSVALFLPILFYSARPFFLSSWQALRQRRASMDLPIVLALIAGFTLSILHLKDPSQDLYVDSLSLLVFLLLSSRYLMLRMQQAYLGLGQMNELLSSPYVRVWNKEKNCFASIPTAHLQKGDQIEVKQGETIPCDGRLRTPQAAVNLAVLTGEPEPQQVLDGESIVAGARLESERCVVEVERWGQDTRMGKILQTLKNQQRLTTPMVGITDRVGQTFTLVVLLISIVFLTVYSSVDLEQAIYRTLAFIIVACPCAMALGTPLAISLGMKRLARSGVVIKSAETLEKISQVRTVYFDKTGTLTEGRHRLLASQPSPLSDELLGFIFALEQESDHPIARSLRRELKAESLPPYPSLEDTQTLPGKGVEGKKRGQTYFLGRDPSPPQIPMDDLSLPVTPLVLSCDGEALAHLWLGDRLEQKCVREIALFKKRHPKKQMVLVSGDAAIAVEKFQALTENLFHYYFGQKSPEDKAQIIEQDSSTMMVGDGVNDALALQKSTVGVAVQGSLEVSLKAADVYLTRTGLSGFNEMFTVSQKTLRAIHRNLVIAGLYNGILGYGALAGWVNPLVAAIVMPLSSLTILTSCWLGIAKKEIGSETSLNKS